MGPRNRHSIWIKTIATVVVCLFLVNTIVWAYPDLIESRSTLAVSSQVASPEFRERFAMGGFLLAIEGTKDYIEAQVKAEKDIFKDNWKKDRTEIADLTEKTDYRIRGRIKGKVSGLNSIVFVKLSGLMASTGQSGFVDLTGEIETSKEFGGIAVVYIDSMLCNTSDDCIQKHEIDEVIQWEDLRVNILNISREEMGQWIRNHMDTVDDELKNTACEGLNSRQIAELFHGYSYPLRKFYNGFLDHKDTYMDYGYIQDMLTMYPLEKSKGVCIGARPDSTNASKGSDESIIGGTICDDMYHEGLLEEQINVFYRILTERATKAGVSGMGSDRHFDFNPLKESEVINALIATRKLAKLGTTKKQLLDIIRYIREHSDIPDSVQLLFGIPPDNKLLWWIYVPETDDAIEKLIIHGDNLDKLLYDGGYFRRPQEDGIYISLPLVLAQRNPAEAALAIAKHYGAKLGGPLVSDYPNKKSIEFITDAARAEVESVAVKYPPKGFGKVENLFSDSSYPDWSNERLFKGGRSRSKYAAYFRDVLRARKWWAACLKQGLKRREPWALTADGEASDAIKRLIQRINAMGRKGCSVPPVKKHEGYDHNEFYSWLKAGIDAGRIPRGLPLVLFDSHDDYALGLAVSAPEAEWVFKAKKEGLIGKVYWVRDVLARIPYNSPEIKRELLDYIKSTRAFATKKAGYTMVADSIDELPKSFKGPVLVSIDYDYFCCSKGIDDREPPDSYIADTARKIFDYLLKNNINVAAVDISESGPKYVFQNKIEVIKRELNANFERYLHAMQASAQRKPNGSPAEFLETARNNLLEQALNENGFAFEDIAPLRKYDKEGNGVLVEYDPSTVYKEIRILISLHILERIKVDGKNRIRFTAAIRSLDIKRAGLLIDVLNNIEYKIGEKDNPLQRYEIPKKKDVLFVKELVRNVIAIENAQHIPDILPSVPTDEGRYYVPRYNESKLRDYALKLNMDIDVFRRLLDLYVRLLRLKLGGVERVDDPKPTSGANQPLISMECYSSLTKTPKTLIGEGHVNIDSEIDKDSTLRLIDMASIAFAVSNIPLKPAQGELDQYSRLISFIQTMYKELTGKDISREKILRPNRIITLPNIKPITFDSLRKYYEFTIKQLEQAA